MEQTLALIERSHKGDKDARNILAQQNMGLVYTVARRFNGRGCEMEDLIQIGSIGLSENFSSFLIPKSSIAFYLLLLFTLIIGLTS